MARRLEYVGVETLNRAATIETCNDKGLQALLFAQHGVPHPISRHAYSYAQVRSAVAELGYPAVLKPVSGSWGRGVTRMADEGASTPGSAAGSPRTRAASSSRSSCRSTSTSPATTCASW